LDTAVVFLTPIVVLVARSRGVDEEPFVMRPCGQRLVAASASHTSRRQHAISTVATLWVDLDTHDAHRARPCGDAPRHGTLRGSSSLSSIFMTGTRR